MGFFGFALADSMVAGDGLIRRRALSVEQAKDLIAQGVQSCCNPSHQATIAAMRVRYGIEVPIPSTPPRVGRNPGDAVIVMGVRGLPRLTNRHEYTPAEIEKAEFAFSIYEVQAAHA